MNTKHRRKPYMPDSDSGKVDWMKRFLAQLQTDPKKYGFEDERMFEYLQRTIRDFLDAMKTVSNRANRSPRAVLVKNKAREKAVKLCRSLAMEYKFDPTLTDEDKVRLGVQTRAAAPEKAKLPQDVRPGTAGFPRLTVQGSAGGGHVIRYSDSTLSSKAKPKGVSHMLLFAAIGEKPRMRQTHARLLGAYTKRPFEIHYPIGCGLEGLYVTYYGRWLTTRGEMSPWSPGVSMMIGATQMSLRDTNFRHLFEKEGFIDALPEGAAPGARLVAEDRPLLEGAASTRDKLFAMLSTEPAAKMNATNDPKELAWQAFELLETEMAEQVEDEAVMEVRE